MSTPQCKYNIIFSKGRSERCERKQKRNESDKRNAQTWVRILSYIYSDKEQKHQLIMNYTLAQVFTREFCKSFLFIEHLWATAFK